MDWVYQSRVVSSRPEPIVRLGAQRAMLTAIRDTWLQVGELEVTSEPVEGDMLKRLYTCTCRLKFKGSEP